MSKKIKQSKNFNDSTRIQRLSNSYEVTIGGFGYGSDLITAYTTSIRINDTKESNDFTFFESVASDKAWPVSKIIQREINFGRVEEISGGYINSKKKVKYFPPITVVLLPKSDKNQLLDSYEFSNLKSASELDNSILDEIYTKLKPWSAFDEQDEDSGDLIRKSELKDSSLLSEALGIYILKPYKHANYGIISWDKSKYYAIVIDGQHRLSSLYKSSKERDLTNYIQDVVFIDVSGKSKRDNLTPAQVVRTIFIDINKNPKLVLPSQNILMDDLNLENILVQTLVNDDDFNKSRSGYYLKPQTIDWHPLDLKHELPYLTNILILRDIVQNYFLVSLDLKDKKQTKVIQKWVSRLNQLLDIDNLIETKNEFNNIEKLETSLQNFMKVLSDAGLADDDENDEYIFSFDINVFSVAAYAFEKIYCKSLVYLYENIVPNSKMLLDLKKEGAFNYEETLSVTLPKVSHKRNTNEKSLFERVQANLKAKYLPSYSLLTTVLGQKSILKFYFEYLKENSQILSEDEIYNTTKNFLKVYNLAIDINCISGSNIFGERQSFILEYKRISKENKFFKNSRILNAETYLLDGIVFSGTGLILYKKDGINAFSNLLQSLFYAVELNFDYINKKKSSYESPDFSLMFTDNSVKKKIRNHIASQGIIAEDDFDEVVADIIEGRIKFMDYYFKNLCDNYRNKI